VFGLTIPQGEAPTRPRAKTTRKSQPGHVSNKTNKKNKKKNKKKNNKNKNKNKSRHRTPGHHQTGLPAAWPQLSGIGLLPKPLRSRRRIEGEEEGAGRSDVINRAALARSDQDGEVRSFSFFACVFISHRGRPEHQWSKRLPPI